MGLCDKEEVEPREDPHERECVVYSDQKSYRELIPSTMDIDVPIADSKVVTVGATIYQHVESYRLFVRAVHLYMHVMGVC